MSPRLERQDKKWASLLQGDRSAPSAGTHTLLGAPDPQPFAHFFPYSRLLFQRMTGQARRTLIRLRKLWCFQHKNRSGDLISTGAEEPKVARSSWFLILLSDARELITQWIEETPPKRWAFNFPNMFFPPCSSYFICWPWAAYSLF